MQTAMVISPHADDAAAPHARVLEIPGGHHYCILKHEQVVVAATRDFLQSA